MNHFCQVFWVICCNLPGVLWCFLTSSLLCAREETSLDPRWKRSLHWDRNQGAQRWQSHCWNQRREGRSTTSLKCSTKLGPFVLKCSLTDRLWRWRTETSSRWTLPSTTWSRTWPCWRTSMRPPSCTTCGGATRPGWSTWVHLIPPACAAPRSRNNSSRDWRFRSSDLLRPVLRDGESIQMAASLHGPRGGRLQGQTALRGTAAHLLHRRQRVQRHAAKWVPGKKPPKNTTSVER